jgi:hypothetical protein
MGNIDVVNAEGIIAHRLCVHPMIGVPDSDTMLAQKLLLEHDEDRCIRVANVHAYNGPFERVMPPLQ